MKTVLCHGCFDGLHLGHIRYLEAAKAFGTQLVVSVTSDQYVNKGPGRPRFTEDERIEALEALHLVDRVVVSDAPNAAEVISQVRPDFYVKGPDYAGMKMGDDPNLDMEIAAVLEWGGQFKTVDTKKWSSSQIIRTNKLSDEAREYCASARDRGFLPDILAAFERADKLKIAFIGETITDIYNYTTPLAKPAKEHILAVVETGTVECFNGGIQAAAKHADWPNTRLVTPLDSIIKKRYINEATSHKLFEVYGNTNLDFDPVFRQELGQAVEECDVCIVIDFGHGALGELERNVVSDAKFLAVACQNNAGNYGFNPVTKYVGADYVCIDEPEARLSMRDQSGGIVQLAEDLHAEMGAQTTIITRGHKGSLAFSGFPSVVPAFADHGVDTMGAGDAFLAVTAPLIAVGLNLEMAAFVGNVAGGIKIGITGHRDHVRREELIRNIEWLLD